MNFREAKCHPKVVVLQCQEGPIDHWRGCSLDYLALSGALWQGKGWTEEGNEGTQWMPLLGVLARLEWMNFESYINLRSMLPGGRIWRK